MLFVGIVFILMWLFQVVFLEHFYEYIKFGIPKKLPTTSSTLTTMAVFDKLL